jgi:hypothetical protein
MDKYTSYVCPRCGDSTPQRCTQRGCSYGKKRLAQIPVSSAPSWVPKSWVGPSREAEGADGN